MYYSDVDFGLKLDNLEIGKFNSFVFSIKNQNGIMK